LSDADQPDAESGDNEDKVQPESADVRATELDLGELEARLNPSDAAGDETNSALLDTQTEFEDAIRELSEFVDTNFPNEIDDASDKAEAGAGDSESMTERDIAPPPFEPAAGLSEEQEDDFADEDDADEMDTKLELARAYMDMGDPEGARGILEEVMEEGAPNHQEQARTLLDKVG
jgi:pilus assembly protein FimV